MNVSLRALIDQAESLPDEDQEDLVEIMEMFLTTRSEEHVFTPEELEHIRRIEAEPFVEADPVEVAKFFAGLD